MKKKLFIITILSALLLLFTGCKSEPEPLRVCIDMEFVRHPLSTNELELIKYNFEYALKQSGGLSDVEIEYVPKSGSERDAALDRIRTEIMAGEGPDVFIVNCVDSLTKWNCDDEALFPYPEEAMENGLFLPLDEYIENNTRFTEWEKLTQPVMEAGRNEYGQQIIPLSYTLPVLCYLQTEKECILPSGISWNEMLNYDGLSDEARMLGDCYIYYKDSITDETFRYDQGAYLEFILGDLADYRQEELLFSEEELLKCMQDIFMLREKTDSGEENEFQDYFESFVGANFFASDIALTHDMTPDDSITMVPIYSIDGGVKATILSFAAVNSNTQRPEDAFTVIDILLRKFTQENSLLYGELIYSDWYGIPMHEELMQEDTPIGSFGWSLTSENYTEFCEVRDKITTAGFENELSLELQKLLLDCKVAIVTGESIEQAVAESYRSMKRMLAE